MLWAKVTFLTFLLMRYKIYVRNIREGRLGLEKRDIITKVNKSANSGISRAELGNLLEDFKTDLLSTLGTQVEVAKTKKRQEQ